MLPSTKNKTECREIGIDELTSIFPYQYGAKTFDKK